ncbi:MAG: DUF1326 domain-containing protein [Gemmata sp.]|nr:DUF1326 domain-containing protein [Gemmata sp.]
MTPLLLTLVLAASGPDTIRGQYVEARTCDVFTGSCFSNADTGLTGKNAVLAWKIDTGTFDGVKLNGLGVAVVLATTDTLGLKQSGPGQSIIYVDKLATTRQREALVKFVEAQLGSLVGQVVAVQATDFALEICPCDGQACAVVQLEKTVTIKTRCLNLEHDKACGNETTQYPPLAKGVVANPAVTVEHSFTGKGLNVTWKDAGRRGAFVGTFVTR